MNFIVFLIVVDIIPLGLLLLGGIYETKYSKFPNTKIGYKNKNSILNKETWSILTSLLQKYMEQLEAFY